MYRKITVLFLLCSIFMPALAQQDAQFSQYMFNSLVVNPAYAGYKEAVNISLLHRDQWAGLEGAPKTQSFIADGAFFNNQNVGLGLSLVNDKIGLQSQTSAYGNYAYRLPVGSDNARLSFGLALGVVQNTFHAEQAQTEDPDDPNFNGQRQSYFNPDAKFGVHFSNENFYAGFSVTNLLSSVVNFNNGHLMRPQKHYFITTGYLASLSESVKFKPSVMLRDAGAGPGNLDLNTFFLFNESIWLGASYRTALNYRKQAIGDSQPVNQNSLVAATEIFLGRNVRLGYAFDYSLSRLASYSNGTHEISLGLVLNRKRTAILSPRYF